MAKQLQLNIPTPCHEDWDAMTPVDKGKFCGSCQKQVVDFTNMSDRQVAEFFKKPSTGSVCGRFMNDQLDRGIEIPKKRIPWVKYFFQFALPAFLLSIKSSSAKAQGKVIVKESKVSPEKVLQNKSKVTADTLVMEEVVINAIAPQGIRTTGKVNNKFSTPLPKIPNPFMYVDNKRVNIIPYRNEVCTPVIPTKNEQESVTYGFVVWGNIVENSIKGSVIDETGALVPGANVRIKNTIIKAAADNYGKFKLNAKNGDILIVTGAGLEPTEFIVKEEKSIEIAVRKASVGEVSFVTSKRKNRKQSGTDVITFLAGDTLQKYFKVFPNPIAAGSTITIEVEKIKEGDYTIQLLNQSGQSIHRKEVWVRGKGTSFSLNVPTVLAGTYFLMITNEKTGKKYSEKIIIQ